MTTQTFLGICFLLSAGMTIGMHLIERRRRRKREAEWRLEDERRMRKWGPS